MYSLRQPLGVVAGITPFNFPAMIPLWKAGPALACGNAFILKPSERDPSVPVRLAELFEEAGLPKGVFQVVHGDKEAVDAILTHPDIKAVGFVGSSDIAQYIYSTAAANGKRAQCFGGAKNHMIVMPDADLDQAVDALIGAGYGSAGERCMAISVAVPVGEETANRLRARLVERVNQLRVGHSLDPKADYGPLITSAALTRVKDYIGQGVEAGADIVVDGRERASDDLTFGDASLEGGYFIGPTLFDHVTSDMTIYTDEIFGPVLCIVRADNYEEALALPSEHEYGNGVAIFTRDGDTARDFVVPRPGRHGRRQRADPGSGGVPQLRRVEALRLRRPQPARAGIDHLLHQGQDRHAAVAVGHQGWRRVLHPDHELDGGWTTSGSTTTNASSSRRRPRSPRSDWRRSRWNGMRPSTFRSTRCGQRPNSAWRPSTASEDAGGSGLRRLDGVRIFEQLAVADPTVAAFMSIHNMCTWMVDTYGTAEQRKALVPRLASMELDRQLLPYRARCGFRRSCVAHQGRSGW